MTHGLKLAYFILLYFIPISLFTSENLEDRGKMKVDTEKQRDKGR